MSLSGSCLKGQCALITGGGQGLGFAIARSLIEHGCHTAIHYFSSREGAETLVSKAQSLGLKSAAFQADLTREDEASLLVHDASAFLGGLSILVNNSGDLVQRRTIEQIDNNYWQQVMAVNVSSLMHVTKAAMPFLFLSGQQEGASIINLASLAGRKGGHPGSLAYSTAKGAVITWTRSLSNELAPKGIRVNALAPGLILNTRFHNTHTTDESARETIRQIPLGRAGTPEDVADAAVFLASQFDGFITGVTLDINGGVYSS